MKFTNENNNSILSKKETTFILAFTTAAITLLLLSSPIATAGSSTQFRLQGLSLEHTCNPNCASLTTGSLFGWAEDDWVPYQLTIDNSGGGSALSVSVVINLDYYISHSGDLFGIDSFSNCFGSGTLGDITSASYCGSGSAPVPGGDSNGLSAVGFVGLTGGCNVGGVTNVEPTVTLVTRGAGEADAMQLNLGSVTIPSGDTCQIQWSNHLALSTGANLVNSLPQSFSNPDSIPTTDPHPNGAGTWPGARIHESSSLTGDVNGVRDVPIHVAPAPSSGPTFTSSTGTVVIDTGFCSSTDLTVTQCSEDTHGSGTGGTSSFTTAYAGDSFYDTATVTPGCTPTVTADCPGTLPTPGGSVDYLVFSLTSAGDENSCTNPLVATQLTSLTGITWPDTQTLGSDGVAAGSVPNSNVTGPLAAGFYAFQAFYSGDGTYPSSAGPCEPFTVTGVFPQPITVSKTATPSFTLTYSWSINKLCSFTSSFTGATDSCSEQGTGTSVKVYYNVTVTHDSGTASGWNIVGDIKVIPIGQFTYSGVSDSINQTGTINVDTNANCIVSDGTGTDSLTYSASGATIPSGVSVDFPYTCTYNSSGPLYDGETNIATVSYGAQTITFEQDGINHSFDIAAGSASGIASWTWSSVSPTVDGGSVKVTDNNVGLLGYASVSASCTKETLSSQASGDTCTDHGNSTSFLYSVTYTLPTDSCLSVSNTATFLASDTLQTGSHTATVGVCPHVSGFLTMGFWKNTNGQKLISGDANTGGVCNSVPYLKQFHPLSDLSSSANCAGVATYVQNTIAAAKCTSSTNTCNAMLKAQMLATALDVYFSASGTYGSVSCNAGNWSGTSGSYTKAGAYVTGGSYAAGSGAPWCAGGDKIAKYNGGVTVFLGTVKVDLTEVICASDGGFCTPGGVFTNTYLSFGGSTHSCLSVFQMLAWQNVADPTADAGAAWYNQVKGFQVMAKDAFDAINNNLAFVC
jgi:hypothetical protein